MTIISIGVIVISLCVIQRNKAVFTCILYSQHIRCYCVKPYFCLVYFFFSFFCMGKTLLKARAVGLHKPFISSGVFCRKVKAALGAKVQ